MLRSLDGIVDQGAPWLPVRSEVCVEVIEAATEHVHVDELSTGLLLYGTRRCGDRRTERGGLITVEIGDVCDVPERSEV